MRNRKGARIRQQQGTVVEDTLSTRDEVERILKEHGAILERQKKHQVWRFPDGRIFVRASTPSDVRAEENNLRDLKKCLGLTEHTTRNGERRPKRTRHGSEPFRYSGIGTPQRATLASKLMALRESLPPIKRLTREEVTPRCFPVYLETVYQTPLTTLLRKFFR